MSNQKPQKPKEPTLKQLTKEWYKKLKEDGFKDIERNEDELKFYDSNVANLTRNHEGEAWIGKRDYYQFAEHFLNEYKFDNTTEQIVWEYHTNGISYRNIAKTLKKAGNRVRSRTPVYEIVKKLRKSMFAMYLLPKIKAYHE